VGQYLSLEAYPYVEGDGLLTSFGGSTEVGNTSTYNEEDRGRVEVEELRALVEELKREWDMLIRECTEMRGKITDHEREFSSYMAEFDRVLADRRDLRSEATLQGREVDRLRRRLDRHY
jgi:uncharacterized coiled-coil DUF342 family protein